MKTAKDPRHLKRRDVVKELFASSFSEKQKLSDYAKEIIKNEKNLDAQIEKAATDWPINKVNKIDLAILRLAVYELETKKVPPKVIIDEAVELAKEFGSESSGPFVNGVLGTVIKNDKK